MTALAREAKSLGLGEEELAGMIRRAYSEAQ